MLTRTTLKQNFYHVKAPVTSVWVIPSGAIEAPSRIFVTNGKLIDPIKDKVI
jgi:hypothetical protein